MKRNNKFTEFLLLMVYKVLIVTGDTQQRISWAVIYRGTTTTSYESECNAVRPKCERICGTTGFSNLYICQAQIGTRNLRCTCDMFSQDKPIDGNWGTWSSFSECSTTCGDGIRTQTRYCNNPPPKKGGLNCVGNGTNTKTCNNGLCPEDGNWGPWGPFSPCSTTCGEGMKTQTRLCDNPAPQPGGKTCSGESSFTSVCNLKACPINGEWGEWSQFSECSVSCGNGFKSRQRFCKGPDSGVDAYCSGDQFDNVTCTMLPCPIDGAWGSWNDFGECSVSCGDGFETRDRLCDNPKPQFGGEACSTGDQSETRTCNKKPCPVAGNWGDWSDFFECSVTCGDGIQARNRSCDNPKPENGGEVCTGDSEEMQSCTQDPCPINGNWGVWSDYFECSVTCGEGIQTRNRSCDNPIPEYGGEECSGDSEDSQSCTTEPCPINGNWGEWSDFFECSVTCGEGMHIRNRYCDNPKPEYGGEDCSGDAEDSQSCTQEPCPINGNWGDWSEFFECSVTCGEGVHTRNRSCDNPKPEYGGEVCIGDSEDTQSCNQRPCPTNGSWGDWSDYYECSVTCGEGVHTRNRSCDNPVPEYEGEDCSGNSEDTQPCSQVPCPINGNWGDWSSFFECSVTCGEGVNTRNRSCDNPKPEYGGEVCVGDSEDSQSCTTEPCPINGNWGDWSDYYECSVTCGEGVNTRNRSCDNPVPEYGGEDCSGNSEDSQPCTQEPCPINGSWGDWSDYYECSVTCGEGVNTRNRSCDNPVPEYGGEDCSGNIEDSQPCTQEPCPINGNWGEWNGFFECSVTCGEGLHIRNRSCDNPKPEYGGEVCVGDSEDFQSCTQDPCPVAGNWGLWTDFSECSASCGNGFKFRERFCDSPLPEFGGDDCVGNPVENNTCLLVPCPIDGNWGDWSNFSDCSTSCDGGIKIKTRICDNPAAQFHGKPCPGSNTTSAKCMLHPCPQPFSKLMVALGDVAVNTATDSVEVIDLNSFPSNCSLSNMLFPFKSSNVVGGLDNQKLPIICVGIQGSCYVYRKNDKTPWNKNTTLKIGRTHSALTRSPARNSGKLMLSGGLGTKDVPFNSTEFLTRSNQWQQFMAMPTTLFDHCMVQNTINTVMVIGGQVDLTTGLNKSAKTYVYDALKNLWTAGPSLNTARSGHGCGLVRLSNLTEERSIIVVGGYDGNKVLATTEILDSGSLQWRSGPSLPVPTTGAVLIEDANGGVILVGGQNKTSSIASVNVNPSKSLYRLKDIGSGSTWLSLRQTLATGRTNHTAFLIPDNVASCR